MYTSALSAVMLPPAPIDASSSASTCSGNGNGNYHHYPHQQQQPPDNNNSNAVGTLQGNQGCLLRVGSFQALALLMAVAAVLEGAVAAPVNQCPSGTITASRTIDTAGGSKLEHYIGPGCVVSNGATIRFENSATGTAAAPLTAVFSVTITGTTFKDGAMLNFSPNELGEYMSVTITENTFSTTLGSTSVLSFLSVASFPWSDLIVSNNSFSHLTANSLWFPFDISPSQRAPLPTTRRNMTISITHNTIRGGKSYPRVIVEHNTGSGQTANVTIADNLFTDPGRRLEIEVRPRNLTNFFLEAAPSMGTTSPPPSLVTIRNERWPASIDPIPAKVTSSAFYVFDNKFEHEVVFEFTGQRFSLVRISSNVMNIVVIKLQFHTTDQEAAFFGNTIMGGMSIQPYTFIPTGTTVNNFPKITVDDNIFEGNSAGYGLQVTSYGNPYSAPYYLQLTMKGNRVTSLHSDTILVTFNADRIPVCVISKGNTAWDGALCGAADADDEMKWCYEFRGETQLSTDCYPTRTETHAPTHASVTPSYTHALTASHTRVPTATSTNGTSMTPSPSPQRSASPTSIASNTASKVAASSSSSQTANASTLTATLTDKTTTTPTPTPTFNRRPTATLTAVPLRNATGNSSDAIKGAVASIEKSSDREFVPPLALSAAVILLGLWVAGVWLTTGTTASAGLFGLQLLALGLVVPCGTGVGSRWLLRVLLAPLDMGGSAGRFGRLAGSAVLGGGLAVAVVIAVVAVAVARGRAAARRWVMKAPAPAAGLGLLELVLPGVVHEACLLLFGHGSVLTTGERVCGALVLVLCALAAAAVFAVLPARAIDAHQRAPDAAQRGDTELGRVGGTREAVREARSREKDAPPVVGCVARWTTTAERARVGRFVAPLWVAEGGAVGGGGAACWVGGTALAARRGALAAAGLASHGVLVTCAAAVASAAGFAAGGASGCEAAAAVVGAVCLVHAVVVAATRGLRTVAANMLAPAQSAFVGLTTLTQLGGSRTAPEVLAVVAITAALFAGAAAVTTSRAETSLRKDQMMMKADEE